MISVQTSTSIISNKIEMGGTVCLHVRLSLKRERVFCIIMYFYSCHTFLTMRALSDRIDKKKEVHFAVKTWLVAQLQDEKFHNLRHIRGSVTSDYPITALHAYESRAIQTFA